MVREPIGEAEKALDEAADRLDRNCVLGRARHRIGAGRGSDIDREHVVIDRWTGGADHPPGPEIEADGRIVNQLRAGETGERAEIDMAVLERVMSGDVARQHAGIRRQRLARDQRDAGTRQGLQGEQLEHHDVGMTAADEDEILGPRFRAWHHAIPRLTDRAWWST